MVKVFGAVCALVLVGGCQTKQVDEMSYSEIRALRSEIENRCVAQGVARGSPNWGACRQQEARREITMRDNNRARMQALGEGLQQAGSGMSAAAVASRPRNCTSNAIGSTVYTNCY